MKKNRDDFTEITKRLVAGRVGYRCSFPDCPNVTIGPSMENTKKVSKIGVAAHICAAAPGGPRFDASMTPEERSGHDNCIWLCSTHATLIDTDETTYSVEKLRQWKREAEYKASKALANADCWSEYYRNAGDNLYELTQIFDDMIDEGNFSQLNKLLSQYKTTLSEQYEEFVCRYKIIYDVYCDRKNLKQDLERYSKLPGEKNADVLAELFLEFHLIEELKVIECLCKNEVTKEYVSLAVKNELLDKWLSPICNVEGVSFPKEIEDTIQKHICNYISINNCRKILDLEGNPFKPYSESFYYKAISSAYHLGMTIDQKSDEFALDNDCNFQFIKTNIDKILYLDVVLQKYIWEHFLSSMVESSVEFLKYYQKCPKVLVESQDIQKLKFVSDIKCDIDSVNADDILDYSAKTGDVRVLCFYLSSIEKEKASQFLDEHAYLLRKNSTYLRLKLELSDQLSSSEAAEFIKRYEKEFSQDFTYHCLLAKYSASDQKKDELNWLLVHEESLQMHDFSDYVKVLFECGYYQELTRLAENNNIPNEFVLMIADYLSDCTDLEYKKISKKIYLKLINKGWERKGLFLRLGQINWMLGLIEESKKSYCTEYDKYGSLDALNHFWQLRYQTHDYSMDKYYEKLKDCVDDQSQNLVAAICMKNNIFSDARKYFLRSLLLNDKNEYSLSGFYSATSHLPECKTNAVDKDTVCILKSSEETIYIAIHSVDVLEKIVQPSNLAGWEHYSVEDEKISPILFREKGELIVYGDKEYKIEDVFSVDDALVKFFFTKLTENEHTKIIRSSTGEDFMEQIKPILKESNDSVRRVIDTYNQNVLIYPLTSLAKNLGKSMLSTCEFLAYRNTNKIINGVTSVPEDKECRTFVLSYEVIVFLAHIEVELIDLQGLKVVCAPQVKNQLIEDINEEMSDLLNSNHAGSLHYEDGKIFMFEKTSDQRRARHSFLMRMKRLISNICVDEDVVDFVSTNEEIKETVDDLFNKLKLHCEGGSLSATKKSDERVLVTDNQFLANLANSEKIANIGLIPFLLFSNFGWKKFLTISQKLKRINFNNYLPFVLYKRIVDALLESNEEREISSSEIQEWIISDSDGEPTSHHEDIILELYKEVIVRDLNYLNPANLLGKLAIRILEKRNPGFLQQCIANLFTSSGTNEDENINK